MIAYCFPDTRQRRTFGCGTSLLQQNNAPWGYIARCCVHRAPARVGYKAGLLMTLGSHRSSSGVTVRDTLGVANFKGCQPPDVKAAASLESCVQSLGVLFASLGESTDFET